MSPAEYDALHGVEPHDEKYWGPRGVNVAGRWGDKVLMRMGCESKSGPGGKISTGRKTRGYASGESRKA